MIEFIDEEKLCICGKYHKTKLKNVLTGSGVISALAQEAKKLGITKAFILADENTFDAAGRKAEEILKDAGIPFSRHIFGKERLEPDENAIGSAILHFDTECNGVIAVGSGVINDIGKILANVTKIPYIIVATAPSMDGYASETSSMARDGLKVSVKSGCPDVIIGDTDILKNAPLHMMKSGLGDMMAKYISICEWRIAHIILDEYYCEEIARLIRDALKKCVDNSAGLLVRDEKAVEAVFEGLVIGGIAMAYAGISRPASGGEHYLSHIWDMRGLEYNLPTELHGIQCAYTTYFTAQIYEKLKGMTPDKNKALSYAAEFDFDLWSNELRSFLGRGAEAMIVQESREGKYDVENHKKRLDNIIRKWDNIVDVIGEELPGISLLDDLYEKASLPRTSEEIGIDKKLLPMSFKASKDIREKYVLPRLLWDLGIIDKILEME